MPTINITILNVTKTPATSKAGKPYEFLDIAYKNNTWQGKVEGKKLMPFGENANAFATLKDAQTGQSFDINVVKNTAGFNDWTGASAPGTGPAPAPQETKDYQQSPNVGYKQAAPAAPARTNTFETPEERAKKQLAITRLATLNTAVAALTPGAKSPLKTGEVLALAKDFENYVYNIPSITETLTGFDDMTDDIPE